jgi:hypothetical protein
MSSATQPRAIVKIQLNEIDSRIRLFTTLGIGQSPTVHGRDSAFTSFDAVLKTDARPRQGAEE